MRFFSMLVLILLLLTLLLFGQGNARNMPIRMRDQRHTSSGRAFPHFFQMIISILSSL